MSFAWDIEVPADTKATTPKTETLKITFGVITKINIKFADGCHRMVRVRLTRGGLKRVAPLNPDGWITGDAEAVEYHTYIPIETWPRELEFVGCSPDTAYPHTVTVRIELLPRQVASMIPVIELLTKLLQRMGVFGRGY